MNILRKMIPLLLAVCVILLSSSCKQEVNTDSGFAPSNGKGAPSGETPSSPTTSWAEGSTDESLQKNVETLFEGGLLPYEKNGVWHYVDQNAKIFAQLDNLTQAKPFSEGLAAVRNLEAWSYIDQNFERKTDFKFALAEDFSEGLAVAGLKTDRLLEYDYGFLNTDCEWEISPVYAGASSFSEGLAAVAVIGDDVNDIGQPLKEWGYINKKGEWVIKPQFHEAGNFENGIAHVMIFEDGRKKYTIINTNGDYLLTPKEGYVLLDRDTMLIRQKDEKTEKYGYIDISCNWVIEPQFDFCFAFSEGLAPVEINDKWGFIDQDGKVVIEPKYKDVEYFSDGLARVSFDGEKWGCIDKKGDTVLPAEYEKLGDFKGNYAVFGVYSHYEPETFYDGFDDFGYLTGGTYGGKIYKYGIINKYGEIIVPAKHKDILLYSEAYVAIRENDVEVITYDGRFIVSKAETVSYPKSY